MDLVKSFLIINGPNLNFLGKREVDVYGHFSLEEIMAHTIKKLNSLEQEVKLDWFQSNSEGEIVSHIGQASEQSYQALIINPAAYSHTSVAITDALRLLACPVIEVHLTNLHQRESFRQRRLTAQSSSIVIEGAGKESYYLAVLSQL